MPNPHLRDRGRDTRAGDTSIQSGGSYGEFGSPPQQERLYTERNPFMTPYQPDFQGQGAQFGGPREKDYMGPHGDMGIMSQPGGYGSDTYNALVGGLNKQRQGGGFGKMSGLSQTWQKILDQTGSEDLANQWLESEQSYNVGDTYPLGGLGRKTGYGSHGIKDYGPSYEELETIPLDMQFDQWGNPIGGDDFGYFDDDFAALSGSGGMNNEMLMAELTQDQKNKMRNQYNAPGLESAPTKQQLFDQIKDMEYKGTLGGYWPGWLGANPPQEPTTWGEFDKEYKHLQDTYWA
jgi:hypothetical protein